MTLTIDLTPEEEARLRAAAHSQGLDPAAYVKRTVIEHLPPLQPGAATLALFARWEAEDATEDPQEIAARNREWEELKSSMNASRVAAGEEPLFP
jgi:hypothetical protein